MHLCIYVFLSGRLQSTNASQKSTNSACIGISDDPLKILVEPIIRLMNVRLAFLPFYIVCVIHDNGKCIIRLVICHAALLLP